MTTRAHDEGIPSQRLPGRPAGKYVPAVDQATYVESAPGQRVEHVLVCGWERRAGPVGDIRVLPDGCADIVWRSDGALFVAGPDRGPATHAQAADVSFVGVRIRAGAVASVLGTAADELCDRQVPLASLWGPSVERLADRMASADTDRDRRRIIAAAVAERLEAVTLDEHIMTATGALAEGDVPLTELCRRLGLSDRHLRRGFAQQVGYGPRTYRRVMRLQRVIRLSRSSRPPGHPGLAGLAAAGGYADQAHLTRECRRLTGSTPAILLRPADD